MENKKYYFKRYTEYSFFHIPKNNYNIYDDRYEEDMDTFQNVFIVTDENDPLIEKELTNNFIWHLQSFSPINKSDKLDFSLN